MQGAEISVRLLLHVGDFFSKSIKKGNGECET